MMKTLLTAASLLFCQLTFAQVTTPSKPIPNISMAKSLAPTGILRVGINLGNQVVAGSSDKTEPQPKGISIDIAREIGKRVELPIELIPFKSAGETVEALKLGQLDLIFVAIDPVRGADIMYTPAYIQIEGSYLVRSSSPITRNEQVDSVESAIVVGKGSAYDLFLSREIRAASLVRAANSQSVVDDFMSGKGNVAAGVRQQLENDAKRYTDLRILPGRFMVINQAIGIPKSNKDAEKNSAYLGVLIQELKASGFIAQAMQRHGIAGAKVAE